MKLYVVDAGVAAKWMLPGAPEPLRAEALSLLNQSVDGQVKLLVPDFFWVEIANLLSKAVQLGRCSKETAAASLSALRRYAFPTVSTLPLLDSALGKAIAYRRSVYDSIYLALAVECAGQLVTADEKLVNAVAGRLPIIWLGAI